MNKPVIYIDESGTLPDPKDRVIIVAAVGVQELYALDLSFKSVKKRRTIGEKPLELKFYKAGTKTKDLFFEKLSKQPISIFILVADKMGRKIPDTPENFATLCGLLLSEILHFYAGVQSIIFDRHFHKDQDEKQFNKILINFLGSRKLQLEHVNSIENYRVNVADMVAGAVFSKETGKEDKFYEMIKSKIVGEIKINWPEAKRRLLEQK